MAFQTRQFVNDQATAPRFNHSVQMSRSDPFATTMENPWLGMNHMLLGSNNMVIQPQTNGLANSLPDNRRKRPRVSTANQVTNFNVNIPVLPYALQGIKNDMIALRRLTISFASNKKVRIQFAEKQNEAMQHLVESVTTPILKKLKEKDDKIVNMGKLNKALQENVKNLIDENQKWKEYALACDIKAMALLNNLEVALDEVSRLQELVPPNGYVAAPPEEQDVESYRGSNVSGKNIQGNAHLCMKVKVEEDGETAAEKVRSGAAETGEGSGEKRMCKSCGKMELCCLALPCRHLCFCIVCGTGESGLYGRPVCDSTMTATAHVGLM